MSLDPGNCGKAGPVREALRGIPKACWALAALAGCIYLTLASALTFTNRPWFDEAVYAGPALNLITHGFSGYPIGEPTQPGAKGCRDHMYESMPFSYLVKGAWYKLAGFGIFRARMFETLMGLLLMTSWAFIVMKLTGRPEAALLAIGVMAFDRAFLAAASSGRPDMLSAAFASMGIAAYLALRENRFALAVLTSQFLFCAAFFTHPVAALSVFILLSLAFKYDIRRLQWNHLPLAGIPYLVGFGVWGWYISRDPAGFHSQFFENGAASRDGGLKHPLTFLARELTVRFGRNMYLSGGDHARLVLVLIPVVYLVAVAALLVAGKRGGRMLGVLAGLQFLVFGVLEARKFSFYLVHMTVLFACCAGVWIHDWWGAGAWRRGIASGAAVLLAALQIGWVGYSVRQNAYHDSYLPAIAFLNQHAGTGSPIFGESELAFSRGFYSNLVDDSTLGYFSGKRAEYIVVSYNGLAESFKTYKTTNPPIDRYLQRTLSEDYSPVFRNRIYTIYGRKF
jgi:4-amino-4-deoxy-L-arabinose transferase-like glycosyltransferase